MRTLAAEAQRWLSHPLCAPSMRRADHFWGPEPLDPHAWGEFSARLDVHAEVARLLLDLGEPKSILDVGGGLGTITKHLPCRGRRCVVVDPNSQDDTTMSAHDGGTILLRTGRAEDLPFDAATGGFDLVLATWMLQYTADPWRAVAEMARVADPVLGRLRLIQAHPGNPIVRSYNRCAQRLAMPVADHGFLLAQAATYLEGVGYRVSLELVEASVSVLNEAGIPDLSQLARTVARLHFSGRAELPELEAIALDTLTQHIEPEAQKVRDDGVLLTAERP